MTTESSAQPDPEITAISEVYSTLKALEPDAQLRVVKYVLDKLKLTLASTPSHTLGRASFSEEPRDKAEESDSSTRAAHEHVEDDSDGISPAGRKWIMRNGLSVDDLSPIFSIGGEEIDLVLKKVPGDKKSKRMRSVFLLKGLAAYLGSGAARFSHADVKETCLHYDAFDAGNFAQYFRGLAAEVSGSKETGYTLTARGLTAAAEIVKQLAGKAE
jgi:hypothetical protein